MSNLGEALKPHFLIGDNSMFGTELKSLMNFTSKAKQKLWPKGKQGGVAERIQNAVLRKSKGRKNIRICKITPYLLALAI